MPTVIVARQTISIGTPTVVEAPAPDRRYLVVFEDDGDTGYLYAVDPSETSQPIRDAVQIYDVQNVADRSRPSVLEIVWSSDHRKVALLINDHPHAVFDFEAKQGFSRSDFPPSQGDWSRTGHAWSDQAMALIR